MAANECAEATSGTSPTRWGRDTHFKDKTGLIRLSNNRETQIIFGRLVGYLSHERYVITFEDL